MTSKFYVLLMSALFLAACVSNKQGDRPQPADKIDTSSDSTIITGLDWGVVYPSDHAGAMRFFTEVLELDLELESDSYAVFRFSDKQAFDAFKEPIPWLTEYPGFGFRVDNMEQAKRRMLLTGVNLNEEAAGRVEGLVTFESFKDSEGNYVQLAMSEGGEKTFDQSTKTLQIKRPVLLTYYVDDLMAASNFYDRSFNGQTLTVSESNEHKLLGFQDGTFFALHQKDSDPGMQTDQSVVIGFEVAELERSIEVLKHRGVELIGEIKNAYGLRWQQFLGPDDILYRLVAVN